MHLRHELQPQVPARSSHEPPGSEPNGDAVEASESDVEASEAEESVDSDDVLAGILGGEPKVQRYFLEAFEIISIAEVGVGELDKQGNRFLSSHVCLCARGIVLG